MPRTSISILIGAAVIAGLAFTNIPAEAGSRAYKRCDISNGQVFSCGSWYQGKAVNLNDRSNPKSDISNGQVFSCGSWYQGKAVVFTDR